MQKLSISLAIVFLLSSASSFAGAKFVLAAFNVENLFDTIHDPGKNDQEYTPEGKRNWTPEKLDKKVTQLAKQIRAINNGRGPDILVMPETENIRALNALNAKLRDLNYNAILLEGPDQRGIDVAMLSRFKLARKPMMVQVSDPSNPIWAKPTRPIYNIVLQITPTTNLGILMNHWPARMAPAQFRCLAAEKLKKVFQAYLKKDPNIDYIAIGDLNDEPRDPSIKSCLGTGSMQQVVNSTPENPLFFNLHEERPLAPEKSGTYFYGTKKTWNTLDHIIFSRGLLDNKNIRYVANTFTRIQTPGLNVSTSPVTLPNGKVIPPGAPVPFTTTGQNGNLDYYGVSDHLPIAAVFEVL
ncbi:MAG: endonuclease/exonuclease/phosphatase family protein [Oligoflexia bacterium]|nr:endonuclease/exonuclease/phosphatase family protein [Oligoflexia bacterium]